MRTRLPDLRTLPSSTVATLSFCATVARSTSLPLKKNADVRDATRRPRIFASTLSSSSARPSAKYSFSLSWLRLTNGNTAIDGVCASAGRNSVFSGGKSAGRSGWQSWKIALAARQVLEVMIAQRLHRDLRRKVVVREFAGRLRHQRLAAVSGGEQPRDPIERGAEVVAIAQFRVARVHRHPDSQAQRRRPRLHTQRLLRGERRREGLGCGGEGGAERVADRLEHVAARVLDGAAHERVVPRQRRAHRGVVRLPQPRAALDIGEQERHRAGGKGGHRNGARRTLKWRNIARPSPRAKPPPMA